MNCPICKDDPRGMFVGWGCGWVDCPKCHPTLKPITQVENDYLRNKITVLETKNKIMWKALNNIELMYHILEYDPASEAGHALYEVQELDGVNE